MKIKTRELTGAALDWVVAKCEGYQPMPTDGLVTLVFKKGGPVVELGALKYSTDWAQSGPIIEREEITTVWNGAQWIGSKFNVRVDGEYEHQIVGRTPRIAAMRCYVASELGDEVDVPEELCCKNTTQENKENT